MWVPPSSPTGGGSASTTATPAFRRMESNEVHEEQDNETTSSWSRITEQKEQKEKVEGDVPSTPSSTEQKGRERGIPLLQILIPNHDAGAPPPSPPPLLPPLDTTRIQQEEMVEQLASPPTPGPRPDDEEESSSEEILDHSYTSSEQVSSEASDSAPVPVNQHPPPPAATSKLNDISLPAGPARSSRRSTASLLASFFRGRPPDLSFTRPIKQGPHRERSGSSGGKRARHQRSLRFLKSAPTRFFFYAVALWILELVLVILLKRAGVIRPEFRLPDAAVAQAQRVLSELAAWNNETSGFILAVSGGVGGGGGNASTLSLPAQVLQNFLWGFYNSTESLSLLPLQYLMYEQKRPGFQLAQQGAVGKYPFLIIPGFVTSGLEVWGGKECARKHFRQRMWAAMVGARSFLTDRDCWRQHMMLDPLTGGDPEGIRVRAASGFEAVDYFMANYWVFGKIIENLADVGYTPSEMQVEPYDWRLAFSMLERRDGYFTRVKNRIETMHKTSGGKKVVIASHSMGVLVVHYFFAWVTSPQGGKGGSRWVDNHVHAYVNIAGVQLGVPKAITSLLSGEMSDTVVMNPMATAIEQFFGRQLRRELWNSWGSVWAMLPKGGDALWSVGADMCNFKQAGEGKAGQENDRDNSRDPFCRIGSHNRDEDILAPFIQVTDSSEVLDEIMGPHLPPSMTRRSNNLIVHKHDCKQQNSTSLEANREGVSPLLRQFMVERDFSLKAVIDYVKEHGLGKGLANAGMYSLYGSPSNPTANRKQEAAWHDPTQTPLPYAPNLKIYCLYGVGKPTERAYYYKLNHVEGEKQTSDKNQSRLLLDPPLILDSDPYNNNPNGSIVTGIKYADGDGSVPLLSLGYLCVDAWTRSSSGLNPGRSPVYTREYKHKAEFTVDDPMRSGPKSGDHVDLLGNLDMTEDLLRILTDFEVEEKVNHNRIYSKIEQIAQDINRKGGGIFQRGKQHKRNNQM